MDTYDESFFIDLVTFVSKDSFQSKFEEFFLTHAKEFSDEDEHKLSYYSLYESFKEMFESSLQEFCDEKKLTQNEFIEKCRQVQNINAASRNYIDVLMSSIEYETFTKLMKIASQSRPRADGKSSDSLSADAKSSKSSYSDSK